jgi:hypothetical protein
MLRRNAIEPVIGHAKSDGLLERNRLAGAEAATIKAILATPSTGPRLPEIFAATSWSDFFADNKVTTPNCMAMLNLVCAAGGRTFFEAP